MNPEEWERMKGHSNAGFKICYPLKRHLGKALEAIRHHHEKLDGSGYPNGLKGEEISMVVRVMAVADIYDALVTDRPYRTVRPSLRKGLWISSSERFLKASWMKGLLDILRKHLELINGPYIMPSRFN